MAPQFLTLKPYVIRSEPNTPIYATSSLPEEASEDWFAAITHKEKVAILTIEHIPHDMNESYQNHAVTSTNDCFSPRLMPGLDRMKFHFARAMALARCEAACGTFDWHDKPGAKTRAEDPIIPMDVMTSVEVEVLLAGIQEVRVDDENNKLAFRRYWRILAPPPGFNTGVGAVISAGTMMGYHHRRGLEEKLLTHWDDIPKILIAEFTIGDDGLSVAGRMLENNGLS